jgi:3-hydroxybutyryl-CoA dehydrogenase
MSNAKIAVIGAGLMGHGIAQVFALAGHDVTITDSFAQNLDTAKSRIAANLRDLGEDESAAENVRACADLAQAVREADYVVEAVLEDLPLKQKLFAEIERHVRPDTVLASNTSVIPITAIMHGAHPARARAWDALVEPALSGAAGRGDRNAMDLGGKRRLDDGTA